MSLRARDAVMDVKPYVAGKSSVAGANHVTKLSSNEGAFGPPPGAIFAIAQAMTDAHRYPEGGATALRDAIGRAHGLDPARIVCGAGSDDIIYQLCVAYGGEGTELLMSAHGFSIYAIAGRLAGCTIRIAAERDLTADVDALLAAVTPATRMVFLANPNNPTGTMLPGREIWRLRDGLPPDVLLVLDAAYAEYVSRIDYEAGAALVDAGDNTVMTRTFSKIYGLGGMRVGWCYAPPAVVDVLDRVRPPFNVSLLAQAAAIAAVTDRGFVERARTHNAAGRATLTAALRACGLRVWDSEGNFVLAGFGSAERAAAADAALQARGIIVRAVGGYGLPECLRITIGTNAETAAVIEALQAFTA